MLPHYDSGTLLACLSANYTGLWKQINENCWLQQELWYAL